VPGSGAAWFLSFWFHEKRFEKKDFAKEEELCSVLSELMSEIPPDMILRVFADWNGRLQLCLLIEGEYVE
jgi:hypothetical protein